jgi:hypothetical protein
VAYGDTVALHVLAWAAEDGLPADARHAEVQRHDRARAVGADAAGVHGRGGAQLGAAAPLRARLGGAVPPRAAAPVRHGGDEPVHARGARGARAQRALTDEQRAITAFWDCNPYVMNVQGHAMFATKKITPGGHWMGIAGIAARQAGASAVETAEAYARTAVALADGFLSAWEVKYLTGVVRPETVINAYLDPAWAPLLQTPPFPSTRAGTR